MSKGNALATLCQAYSENAEGWLLKIKEPIEAYQAERVCRGRGV